MGQPLITVVTPTYKRPDLLQRCIESVIAQTYPAVEHIVIGDNCPDLWGVADDLAKRHPSLSILNAAPSHKNDCIASYRAARTARLRNMGIRLASGKYIAHLDDDDTYDPDHLEKLMAVLESNIDLGASYSYRKIFNKDGTPLIITHHLWLPPNTPEERAEYQRWLTMGNYEVGSNIIRDRMSYGGEYVYTVGMDEWLVRTDIHLRVPLREYYTEQEQSELLTEDTALAIDLIRNGINIGSSEEPTLNVYLGGYSTTHIPNSYYSSSEGN